MASSIESKKSRSKLGSLGGLRTAIIGGSIQEQPQRETRFGDKRSQEQGRSGNHEGRPGRKGKKAEAAAFLATTQGFWKSINQSIKSITSSYLDSPATPCGWGGVRVVVVSAKDSTTPSLWVGGVELCQVSSDREITSVVHSHPPSHYIRKHALG